MPPKTAKPPVAKKGKHQPVGLDESTLEALVNAIEGKVSKKGMTKSQAKKLEEKNVSEAIDRIQGRRVPFTPEQLRNAMLTQQLMHQRAMEAAQYVNVPVPLKQDRIDWQEVAPNKYVRYEQFNGSDEEMDFIVKLFTEELTEPYSSFTYQYFVFGWPDLCVTAYGVESTTKPDSSVKGNKVGAVVSRVTRKGPGMPLRGYVAMFAVVPSFRGFQLGSRLVALTVDLMREKGCDEVYLETPTANERALSLYLSLGFAKTKFLPRYYLDHSDAVRLKLWLKDAAPTVASKAAAAAAAAAAVSPNPAPAAQGGAATPAAEESK